MNYEGKYYNGLVSKGMPAIIVLEHNGISIHYNTGEESGHVFWELEGIQQSEFNDATTLLRYGKYPQQSIAVFEQGFLEALQQKYNGVSFLKSGYSSFLSTGLTGIVAAGLVLLLLVVGAVVWGIPALADRVAAHFPERLERQVGWQLYTQMLRNYEVDSAKTVALKKYLKQLHVTSDFDIEAVVVKDDVVNAFALPGGFVVVHDGILEKMQRHEELAGLLGHEIGHVQLRHSTRAIARSLSYYMLLSVLFGDISGVAAVIVDNASTFQHLEYSRKAELEADKAGLQLLKNNKLEPKGMVWLMERLGTGDDSELTSFMSTHPRTQDRVKELQAQIKKLNYTSRSTPQLDSAWVTLKSSK